MKIKIIGFGIVREILKDETVAFTLDQENPLITDLHQALIQSYPDLGKVKSLAFAINDEYALPNELLVKNDVVVIMPPVSGG